jgi:hypothetical protein
MTPWRPQVVTDARSAHRRIARGDPAVILAVPGWLSSEELRNIHGKRIRAAAAYGPPVHFRWLWLREDENGQKETAFVIWPCRTVHQPGLQCMDGYVAHGNVPFLPRGMARAWSRRG